ncbi:hypothetical protein H4Q26_011175 [Puccinia striiformis f. sp. tritici PST-130]|uniref:Uncharacterized protein n=1 Tax=Puccinia striiformis f. sp. tritici PST-78 TaxID=1165861 RepID=A0A0L0VXA5_9BASI|nr:hypothetical protein H4Q26_011175 [Puccinia striiformis f. sp. tritici PST-130]KNF03896.1 hypothetical protein PSTG_02983 [Puccinia striiformis f. sp. tritici PST-78]
MRCARIAANVRADRQLLYRDKLCGHQKPAIRNPRYFVSASRLRLLSRRVNVHLMYTQLSSCSITGGCRCKRANHASHVYSLRVDRIAGCPLSPYSRSAVRYCSPSQAFSYNPAQNGRRALSPDVYILIWREPANYLQAEFTHADSSCSQHSPDIWHPFLPTSKLKNKPAVQSQISAKKKRANFETPTSAHTRMTGRNSECLRAYFPIHGIRALYSLIEYPYPSNFQEGDCENLAYGARNSGVITSRPFARSQWKLTLGKCSGSDAKFQTSQNVQGGSGIKARFIKLCDRVSKISSSQNPSIKDPKLEENYLSLVSNSQGAQTNIIRRVDVCLTIAFGALRRNSYFTKITEYGLATRSLRCLPCLKYLG